MKLTTGLRSLFLPCAFSSLVVMACGNGGGTTGTTGSGGAGGQGGGPVVYPVCMKFSAAFTGTLDGKPFNNIAQTHLIGFDQGATPPTMDVSFDESGDLILHWSGPMTYGKLTSVIGTLMLPGESKKRNVLPGSTVISQDNFYYKFDLVLDSGHLIGCAYST